MVKSDSITKIAITGNTLLTLKSIQKICQKLNNHYNIVGVFGINEQEMQNKVNSVCLKEICQLNGIYLDQSGNWDNFHSFCDFENIDLIICLGDSRIVPNNIVEKFKVIGNHGAILPSVHGGASLVWGRMFNTGEWGISIMEIGKEIDSGVVLKVKKIYYDKDITQERFVEICDDTTVDALMEVLEGNYEKKVNSGWNIRIKKHTDSLKAIKVLNFCLKNNLNIYLPSRTPEDSQISDLWHNEFVETFKIANDYPYPRWRK